MNLQKIEHEVSFDQLAGFDNYRQWIEPLVPLLESGDPLAPRGALLAGMPGTGKASCVLATAKLIGRPVIRYHPKGTKVSAIISELPDEPIILWLDEPDESCIELLRFLALQPDIGDKVLVMTTTSKPHMLPATFTGAAIFDRIWHLDLPDVSARAFLWDCLIGCVGGNPGKYDNVKLAQVSALFTPAEIEAVVRQAHAGVEKPPSEKKILAEIVRKTPCAALQDEETASVRYWARRTAESV
ncbi:ATP-binding protein [Verrucomicrobiaceae bacterium N1E253]|uniref:ATP-binding protein n=1 Tax=Oceaniferula marina TaxID=2748318 RepID=A0A851GKE4_9BACT|nr:ATP-binding protein [Oceaniferula marina]NWK55645.1 ATP-binding protein [Oceaniferula marina]